MPAPIAFQLDALNLPQVVQRVNDLPRVVASRLVRTSMRAGGKIVLARVKAAVPRESGALYRSLRLRSGGFAKGMMQMRIFTGNLAELGYPTTRRAGRRGGRGKPGYPPAAIEFGFTRATPPTSYVYERRRRSGRQGEVVVRQVVRKSRATKGGQRVAPRSFMRGPFDAVRQQVLDAIGADLARGLEETLKASTAAPGGGT